MQNIIFFLCLVFAFSYSYGWETYKRCECIYSNPPFFAGTFNLPEEISIEKRDSETLDLKVNKQIFSLPKIISTSEYAYGEGIFVQPEKRELLNRAALYIKAKNLDTREVCSYHRGPESPVGYYLSPVLDDIYKSDIHIFETLHEVSIVKKGEKLRVTFLEKNNPKNVIQFKYKKVH